MEVPLAPHSAPARAAAVAVWGLGVALIAVVLWLTAQGALAVWLVPVLLASALALALVRLSPAAQLAGVLVLQVFQLGGEAGLSVGEIVAGLALVGYLALWYGRALGAGAPIVTSRVDVAAALWTFVVAPAAVVLGLLFGADPTDFRADLLATLPFALYFPVKDVCAREEKGGLVVAGALLWLGAAALVLNALAFREVIATAEAVWEIADARFITGETSITAALLLSMAGLGTARRWSVRVLLAAATAAFAVGLIVMKSRGFWVSAALGVVYLLAVLPARSRWRLAAWGGAALAVLVLAAVTVLGDELILIADGTVRRFATLATATTQDISLVNRFRETEAAVDMALRNPILGYGWGVQVKRFNVIYDVTFSWAFVHNGYVALWVKTGLWGLALMLAVWVGGIVRGTSAGRGTALSPSSQACALGAASTLIAFSLVANSSNPFSILDQMMVVTLLLGLTNGLADRARARAAP